MTKTALNSGNVKITLKRIKKKVNAKEKEIITTFQLGELLFFNRNNTKVNIMYFFVLKKHDFSIFINTN